MSEQIAGSSEGAERDGIAQPLDTFVLDPSTGVLVAPGERPRFEYFDATEAAIADAIAAAPDRSPWAEQLAAQAIDERTRAHLGSARWALLDCLDLPRGGQCLEFGAGLGAITAWLARHCDRVDAVEPSLARAATVRIRCADEPGVRVVCGDPFRIEPEPRYDIVTLVGVLEHAHTLDPVAGERTPARSALALLRRARGWLGPNGVLVLAIDNRLGLRLLAGAPDASSGRPYAATEGFRRGEPAVTFSRAVLERLLRQSGFGTARLLLPFPDFRSPTTILAADRLDPRLRLAQWIRTPFGLPDNHVPAFNEARALREVEVAGLLPDLANSFLLVASADADPAPTPWIARHYSLHRRLAFAQRRTLAGAADTLTVATEPLAPAALAEASTLIAWEPRGGPFVFGRTIAWEAISGPEPPMERLRALGPAYAAWLAGQFATGAVDDDGVALLEGRAFDATMTNVIVSEVDDSWQMVDHEVRTLAPLPLDYVVWRSTHQLLASWEQGIAPDRPVARLAWELTEAIVGPLPLARRAAHFAREIGYVIDWVGDRAWWARAALDQVNGRAAGVDRELASLLTTVDLLRADAANLRAAHAEATTHAETAVAAARALAEQQSLLFAEIERRGEAQADAELRATTSEAALVAGRRRRWRLRPG